MYEDLAGVMMAANASRDTAAQLIWNGLQNTTKQALEAALKNMLLKKPLDKITIQDLTSDCGISRMAFYYHLKIFTIWWNGRVMRMLPKRFREKRLMIPGRRASSSFLKRFWKTSLSSSMLTAASAGIRLKITYFALHTT